MLHWKTRLRSLPAEPRASAKPHLWHWLKREQRLWLPVGARMKDRRSSRRLKNPAAKLSSSKRIMKALTSTEDYDLLVLGSGAGASIDEEKELHFASEKGAHFLLFDLN